MGLIKRNEKVVFGWSMYDFANSAFATTISAVIFNKYFAGVVAGGEKGIELKFFFWNLHIPGSSFYNFTVSTAMIIVAVSSPILGAIADYSNSKKRFLQVYCYTACIFTGLLYFVKEGDYWLGAFFFIIANIGFSGGNVFYNAFLPEISDLKDMGKVSGLGWALGYIGGGGCLLLNLIMLNHPQLIGFEKGFFTIHHCFLSVGIWWIIFSIPTFLLLKENRILNENKGLQFYIKTGYKRVKKTLKEIKKFKELVKFLVAFLIYNDGIQTVIIMASIFGDQVLKMTSTELIIYFLVIQGTAFFGSIIFGYIVDIINNKKTILITLFIWCIIVIWAFFIGVFIDAKTEYWILGILAGLVLGGSQSASRSLQGSFTPAKNSAEFFGFYAIANKFASIFGPLVFGIITLLTGNLKTGILALIVFFITGMILLHFVDEKKGIMQARYKIN